MPQVDGAVEPPPPKDRNYVGWLLASDLAALKAQVFRDAQDQALPAPRALLYRLLHRALLLANYDATMKLYEAHGLARSVRRESEFVNVEAGRTVTRWEFMEAGIGRVLPQVAGVDMSVAGFLNTRDGLQMPAALTLAEVKASMASLEDLPTARLERLFAEHIDLCAYRLDAWQTGMFANRLAGLRRLRPDGEPRAGIHLGAYGWLENLRPAPDAQTVEAAEIPESLREEGVPVFSQPGNAGYIHAPSINHAVAAAVLRNAYLTHADEARPEQFAINLTSERVRTALNFLEGVRNGQELGALLGYQFERGLHDRYAVGGVALEQFILNMRKKYPLVADKITAPGNGPVDTRETYNVLDGYALVEAAFLDASPLGYPYGVDNMPGQASPAGQAIRSEVERLAASLDAVADLALAEGVYQVAQGNYDRAGAMLKALSEGSALPEPEIAATPRSGVAVHHKVAVHLETGAAASPWGGPATPRAAAERGLNRWLAAILGRPAAIRVTVSDAVDGDTRIVPIADLGLQPIDLVLLIGDQAGTGDLTELERRIDDRYRRLRREADADWDDAHRVAIRFMDRQGFASTDKTVFELLPLLKGLRQLVTRSRPLGANDYALPSEQTSQTDPAANPAAWDAEELRQRLETALDAFRLALNALEASIATFPDGALNEPAGTIAIPNLDPIDFEALRRRLIRLANFGIPDAFPVQAVFPVAGPGPDGVVGRRRSQQQLIRQALLVAEGAAGRHRQAVTTANLEHLTPEAAARLSIAARVEIYRSAARLILGDAFNLLPVFSIADPAEWKAAYDFGRLGRLTRHHAANVQIVEEWVQGVAAVRENVAALEGIRGFHEAFNDQELPLLPVQLPHAEAGYWVAVAYPDVSPADLDGDVFVPAGDYLSIAVQRPADYDPAGLQAGLLIDEWSELIPNRVETTGIAVHYNQPNTEPPQTLLLAVSPNVNGKWSWNDLVDVVADTFDRARRRGVEPDHLTATPFAQLLPAVFTSVTSGSRFATISTPLVTTELSANS